MTIRNCRFELRLSKAELNDLTRKARKARLTNAGFIRCAIREQEVKEADRNELFRGRGGTGRANVTGGR